MMRTPTTRIQVWMVLLVVSAVLTTTGAFPGPHQDASGSSRSSSLPSSSSEATGHKILEEEVVYSRWRIFLRRLVQMPNDKVVDFDVIAQKGNGAAIIFAWNSTSKTATLCREYNPGPHEVLYGLAAGLIEDKHGADPRVAAEHELEEECHLRGGRWYSLTDRPLAMDKYVTTRVYPYLVIDPEVVTENVRPLDEEEDIEIVTGVTVEEIHRLVGQAEMNIIGSWASLLALNKLRELGEI